MVNVEQVKIGEKTVLGVKVELPDSPPLLIMVGRKGFVMCGFLNIDAAEKARVAAAMVSGVRTFDDVLGAEVKAATSKAKDLGVKTEMSGKEALSLMV